MLKTVLFPLFIIVGFLPQLGLSASLAASDTRICEVRDQRLYCWDELLKAVPVDFIPDYQVATGVYASPERHCLQAQSAFYCWSWQQMENIRNYPEFIGAERVEISNSRSCKLSQGRLSCLPAVDNGYNTPSIIPEGFSFFTADDELVVLDDGICRYPEKQRRFSFDEFKRTKLECLYDNHDALFPAAPAAVSPYLTEESWRYVVTQDKQYFEANPKPNDFRNLYSFSAVKGRGSNLCYFRNAVLHFGRDWPPPTAVGGCLVDIDGLGVDLPYDAYVIAEFLSCTSGKGQDSLFDQDYVGPAVDEAGSDWPSGYFKYPIQDAAHLVQLKGATCIVGETSHFGYCGGPTENAWLACWTAAPEQESAPTSLQTIISQDDYSRRYSANGKLLNAVDLIGFADYLCTNEQWLWHKDDYYHEDLGTRTIELMEKPYCQSWREKKTGISLDYPDASEELSFHIANGDRLLEGLTYVKANVSRELGAKIAGVIKNIEAMGDGFGDAKITGWHREEVLAARRYLLFSLEDGILRLTSDAAQQNIKPVFAARLQKLRETYPENGLADFPPQLIDRIALLR